MGKVQRVRGQPEQRAAKWRPAQRNLQRVADQLDEVQADVARRVLG